MRRALAVLAALAVTAVVTFAVLVRTTLLSSYEEANAAQQGAFAKSWPAKRGALLADLEALRASPWLRLPATGRDCSEELDALWPWEQPSKLPDDVRLPLQRMIDATARPRVTRLSLSTESRDVVRKLGDSYLDHAFEIDDSALDLAWMATLKDCNRWIPATQHFLESNQLPDRARASAGLLLPGGEPGPVPNLARFRLMRGRREGRQAEAEAEVRHLGLLLISTGQSLTSLQGLALLRLELQSRLGRGDIWGGPDVSTLDTLGRVVRQDPLIPWVPIADLNAVSSEGWPLGSCVLLSESAAYFTTARPLLRDKYSGYVTWLNDQLSSSACRLRGHERLWHLWDPGVPNAYYDQFALTSHEGSQSKSGVPGLGFALRWSSRARTDVGDAYVGMVARLPQIQRTPPDAGDVDPATPQQ